VNPLDYYLILSEAAGHQATDDAEGIVVEEFVRDHDCSTVGLNSTVWTSTEARWSSSASLSRGMRTDPALCARVTPASRGVVEAAYRRLGAGQLPTEAMLRTYFRDYQPFATAVPLRLGPTDAPDGFHEKRMYRVLFAKDLHADQLANLSAVWQLTVEGDPCIGGVPGGHRRTGDDHFIWNLRRIGGGIAWCLDLTGLLATNADDTVGPMLYELTSAIRQQGLIPVTTERFA
jgi:hypothetical protein